MIILIILYNYITSLKEDDETIDLDTAIDKAIASIKRYGIKYYYSGMPLFKYCEKNGLNIDNVRGRILLFLNDYDITLDEAIEKSVKYYERKKYQLNITKIFNYLNSYLEFDEDILLEIIEYLNIDLENFTFLRKDFKISVAIAIIWYFHDNEENKKLSISNDKLREILAFVRNIPNINMKEITKINLGYLYGIYKSHLFDTRYLIVLHQEDFNYRTIINLQAAYALNLNRETIEEINSEANVLLLELIDKIDRRI